jgi:mRNA interferase MazF
MENVELDKIYRGEIYLADLDLPTGSEIGKTRPVLVIQNDENNLNSSTVIIAPLTTNPWESLPTHVRLQKKFGLDHESTVLCEQIKTLDKCRFIHRICTIPSSKMKEIDEALAMSIAIATEPEIIKVESATSFNSVIFEKIEQIMMEVSELDTRKTLLLNQLNTLETVLEMDLETPCSTTKTAAAGPVKAEPVSTSEKSKRAKVDYLEMFQIIFETNNYKGLTNKEMTDKLNELSDSGVTQGSTWNALKKATQSGHVVRDQEIYCWNTSHVAESKTA